MEQVEVKQGGQVPKLCPWPDCTSQPEVHVNPTGTDTYQGQVKCADCGASGPMTVYYKGGKPAVDRAYSEAIAAWNNRPTETHLTALLDQAEEALARIVEHCSNDGYGNPIVNERIVDRCDETARAALTAIRERRGR